MPFREIVSEEPTIIIEPEQTKKPIQHTIPPQIKKSIFPKIINPEVPQNPSVITGKTRTTIPNIPFIEPTPIPTPAAPAPVPPPAPIPDPIPEPVYQPPVQQPQMIQMTVEEYQRLFQQQQQPLPPQYVPEQPPKKKIKLPSIAFPEVNATNSKKIGMAMVKLAVSVILIWFGLTSTGSYFGPASGRFGGQLAQIFYQYQIGSLVCMFGVVILYDAITKLRN